MGTGNHELRVFVRDKYQSHTYHVCQHPHALKACACNVACACTGLRKLWGFRS